MPSLIQRRWGLVALLLLTLATALLSVSAWRTPYFGWDVTLSQSLQSMDIPGLEAASSLLHRMGETKAVFVEVLALSGVLFFTGHRKPAALVLAVLVPDILNQGLKTVIERARPDASLVQVLVESQTNSFPSGHVVHITILLGILLYLAVTHPMPRWATVAGAFLLVVGTLLMGASRVYEGAHWGSDVLGGYLWGLLYLWVMLYGYRRWRRAGVGVAQARGAKGSHDRAEQQE